MKRDRLSEITRRLFESNTHRNLELIEINESSPKVVNAIVEDREPCSSVNDGVHSAAVVEAIIQSAKTDSRIDVKD